MKEGKITCLLLLTLLTSALSYSQVYYTSMVKNFNSSAKNLDHYLNKTGDSLHLGSTDEIYKIGFYSDSGSKNFSLFDAPKKVSIPLNGFPVGEYTVAVYQEKHIIVFGVNRDKPFPDEVADIKEDIFDLEIVNKDESSKIGIKKPETAVAEAKKPKQEIKKAPEKPVKKEPKVVEKTDVKKELKKSPSHASVKRKKQRPYEKKKKQTVAKKQPKQNDKKEKVASAQDMLNRKAAKSSRDNKTASRTQKDTNRDKAEITANTRNRVMTQEEIEARMVKYNISDVKDRSLMKQTREEYRKTHLRPNGKKYD